MKREYIRKVFTNLDKLKAKGIYFSGVNGEGEYKRWWYDNGQLKIHCFYKNDKLNGEYKEWYSSGKLNTHCFYKNNKLDGDYKGWWQNGRLEKQCFFLWLPIQNV